MRFVQTIEPKSDQLNSDDLIAGPRTITIAKVVVSALNPDQPASLFFEGDSGKPWRPCKSMRRLLVAVWGDDEAAYVGRSVTLYRDPEVTFGKDAVGGIRISHMSNIAKAVTLALTRSKGVRRAYQVAPLVIAEQTPRSRADRATPTLEANCAAARAEAARGTAAFRKWWSDNPAARPGVQPMMGELKALAAAADAANDDPFGLPTPTPEEFARAEAEALAAIATQDQMQ